MAMRGRLGLHARLSVKVIRAKPTLRQRLMDMIGDIWRRLSA